MSEWIMLWYREIIIGGLGSALIIALWKIRRLKKSLMSETRRQLIPVITMEINPRKPGIFLKNEGNCYAKDIHLEDTQCRLDYDFKKDVTLRFDRVGFLKPSEKVKLGLRIFDGPYEIPSREIQTLFAVLSKAAFEVRLVCANIEDSRYTVCLIRDKDCFRIKQILPYRDPDDSSCP